MGFGFGRSYSSIYTTAVCWSCCCMYNSNKSTYRIIHIYEIICTLMLMSPSSWSSSCERTENREQRKRPDRRVSRGWVTHDPVGKKKRRKKALSVSHTTIGRVCVCDLTLTLPLREFFSPFLSCFWNQLLLLYSVLVRTSLAFYYRICFATQHHTRLRCCCLKQLGCTWCCCAVYMLRTYIHTPYISCHINIYSVLCMHI